MAEVFLAHDLLLDRPVALKVLFPELSTDRNFVERFRREAQAAANLSHPNIVSIYDWGEEDGTYFIVMEYVDGRPLSQLIRTEGTLPPDRAADIGAAVAAALAFAHRNGVIHRDVKPGNVLIDAAGNVKVTDFGIARAVNAEDNLTQTGTVMGTATYFSPRAGPGLAASTPAATSTPSASCSTRWSPASRRSPARTRWRSPTSTCARQPTPPRQVNPDVPAPFEAIVLQAHGQGARRPLRHRRGPARRPDPLPPGPRRSAAQPRRRRGPTTPRAMAHHRAAARATRPSAMHAVQPAATADRRARTAHRRLRRDCSSSCSACSACCCSCWRAASA